MSEEFVRYVDYKTLESAPDGPPSNEDKRCTLFDKPTLVESHRAEPEALETKVVLAPKDAPASYLHDMQHDEDPKQLLLDKIGDLSGIRLSGAQVLVATYIRPEKKKSGLILTSNVREEDKFQGKCGLLLKTGPLAYIETDKINFGGYKAKEGDWVWYRPMDGYALSVNGVHCRVIDDVEIKGDIDHPDLIL